MTDEVRLRLWPDEADKPLVLGGELLIDTLYAQLYIDSETLVQRIYRALAGRYSVRAQRGGCTDLGYCRITIEAVK